MNRAARFAMLVQTGVQVVLVEEGGRSLRDYVGILARALKVSEEAIPEDFEQAARDFLSWEFGADGEPWWYAAWRETCNSG